MDTSQINAWFPREKQQPIVKQLSQQVGLTHTRAVYFVKLWVYLLAKAWHEEREDLTYSKSAIEPFEQLTLLPEAISCSHREAAELFYSDKDTGSDRAAGMMLEKLAALGLIHKYFDGNTTRIEITVSPGNFLSSNSASVSQEQSKPLTLDAFDPRSDAVPVANLLAINYSWMNNSLEIVPHRITRLLRRWAGQYATGMRVLRRTDNLNPVGFYLMYPTAAESELNFSSSPTKGLHLASMNEIDPFILAKPGDSECTAVFIRSWMIDPLYIDQYRALFLVDAQDTLRQIQQDFPNLCDLHTLIIHPSYEAMAIALGFQKIGLQTSRDTQLYWMYQSLDRYLALDVRKIFPANS